MQNNFKQITSNYSTIKILRLPYKKLTFNKVICCANFYVLNVTTLLDLHEIKMSNYQKIIML